MAGRDAMRWRGSNLVKGKRRAAMGITRAGRGEASFENGGNLHQVLFQDIGARADARCLGAEPGVIVLRDDEDTSFRKAGSSAKFVPGLVQS